MSYEKKKEDKSGVGKSHATYDKL